MKFSRLLTIIVSGAPFVFAYLKHVNELGYYSQRAFDFYIAWTIINCAVALPFSLVPAERIIANDSPLSKEASLFSSTFTFMAFFEAFVLFTYLDAVATPVLMGLATLVFETKRVDCLRIRKKRKILVR